MLIFADVFCIFHVCVVLVWVFLFCGAFCMLGLFCCLVLLCAAFFSGKANCIVLYVVACFVCLCLLFCVCF